MTLPESATGHGSALSWKSYSVRRSDKEPLLQFIVDGLTMRGCRVVSKPSADRAPFYVVYETPDGERRGLLAYAFFANSRSTKNRPANEHRFQIKYGSELKGILEVAIDPTELVTTIFLGIDPERGIFVAADPEMNNPSPMSRSVEFKDYHVDEILTHGWAAWERDRAEARTKTRPAAELEEDVRVEVLVGGQQDRLLDLILLERLGRGLDPGERHLLADKLATNPALRRSGSISHPLLNELGLASGALFDLIDGTARLKMAVRGWVAEAHLQEFLSQIRGVTECERLVGEGQPDISLRWKGGRPILIECKNVLRKLTADRSARVDFQRTRASQGDPCSRFYQSADFTILAACLHAVSEQWAFSFALTSELPEHDRCPGRISNRIVVREPVFTTRPELVFDKCS